MRRFGAFGFFLFLAAAVVAGCGGGGSGNSAALPAHGGAGGTARQAALQIFIPQPASASVARAPQYISASTKSIVITLTTVNGVPPSPAVPPTVFNISVPPCSTVSGGISCSVTVGAILGTDVFTIVAYDAANGSGNILSSGTLSVAVGPGTNTPPPIALGGNVAKVVVTAPPSASPAPNGALTPTVDGNVNTVQVSVAAYDASGNLIVGSAPFASPIPITLVGDPNGALTFSPSSVIAPNQNIVTLGTSGKMFYATPSPAQPTPTLATATITFGPSGANGTTFTIDPIQIDQPSGGLNNVLPAPATTTLGVQEAGATSFIVSAFFPSSTQTPFVGECGSTFTSSPSLVPLTCTASSGNAFVTLQSLAGGSGTLSVTSSDGSHGGTPFIALGAQGAGSATLGYTVLLWTMPNAAIPTSMTTGPGGQHLWVAGLNATLGGSVTAIPAQNLATCSAASSPCTAASTHQATLPQATFAPAHYVPAPGSIVVGGDGNMWYTDLGTNSLTNQTLGYFTASACIVATTCAIPNSFAVGPGTTSVQVFSSSPEAIADGGDGNIYMLFGNTSGGGAVSAASYSGFPSPSIDLPESLSSLAPSVTSPIAEGIVRGPDGAMWMSLDDPLTGSSGPTSAIVEFSNCVSGASFLCASSANTKQFPENETTSPGSGPYHPGEIVAVPAANDLWFINHGSSTSPVVAPFIESISSATASYGTFGARISIPNAASVSGTLLLGSDGNLWFPITTASGSNEICRYTLVTAASGTPQFYCATIPPVAGISYPAGPMAVGPDGNIWFGLVGAPYVGEVVL
ncbi:MAG: hypothetical protein HKL91_06750 [Candidatus Eremiobacteraeota bacterium]|uniref:Uncharacterized protein n=1 Tax=mine drainage metagenome TaxID=410659 RepID=E6PFD3_9ZZZZ|nr:hypothetical protein [Candidatus Eremiobacteraeota bacterium]